MSEYSLTVMPPDYVYPGGISGEEEPRTSPGFRSKNGVPINNLDDDSDIDFSETIGSIGSLLEKTINQLRTSGAQINAAIDGTTPHTTTTTATGTNPLVFLAAAAGVAAIIYYARK